MPLGQNETILAYLMYTWPCFWMKCFGVLNGVISRTVVPPERHFIRRHRAFGDPAIAVTQAPTSVSARVCFADCDCRMWTTRLFSTVILSVWAWDPVSFHSLTYQRTSLQLFFLSFGRWIKPSLLHHHPWQRNMFLFLPFWNKTKQLAIDSTSLTSYHSFFQSPLEQSSPNCLYSVFQTSLPLLSWMYSPRLSYPICSINGFCQRTADQGQLRGHGIHAGAQGPEFLWKLWCHRLEIWNFWTRGLASPVCSGRCKVYSPPCWWPSGCQS